MTQGKSQGQHVTPSVTMEMTCDNLQHLCCSADGTVWVCRRPQILQLDRKGQTLLLLEVKIEICGLAAGLKDDLIFTDGKNKRLIYTRFDGDVITKKVMSTNDWFPIGICFAENGDIVVGLFLPSARGRVTRYSEDGDVISAVEHDNHGSQLYSFPAFVAENGNGDIVVSDHLRRAVIVVDRWGRYRFTYTADKLNRPDAVPFLPFGVCCDSLLNIIVADSCNDCLHLVSVNGEFLYILLSKSSGLYRPVALSMTKNEKLFVGDRNGIKIFKLDRQQVSTEDRKSSRSNSLSSLEINRVSGSGDKTQMPERVRVGSHSSGSLSLHRSSTEKGISTMADFGRKEQTAVSIQKSQSLRVNQSVPNLNVFASKQKGEGGSVNKIQTPQQVNATTSQSSVLTTNNPNSLHSSSTSLNKAATLPLKSSMTNLNSGMPSPFTFRKTNTLAKTSRTMEQSPLSITTASSSTCTTLPRTSLSTSSTTTLHPSHSKDLKTAMSSSGATANTKIKDSMSSLAVATQVSTSHTSSVSLTKEPSGMSNKTPTSKTIPDKSSDKKSSSSPPVSNNESVTKSKPLQSPGIKEATGTPKSSPKKAKSAKSSKDSKEKDTKGMKSPSGTSYNETVAKVKPISDSKKSQSPGMKEISTGTSKKTSSASSSSKDSKVKKTGGQDTKKEPEVVSSSGRDNSQNHVQIHSKTGEVKQNPQSTASSRESSSPKELLSETKQKTTVPLQSESNKTDVTRKSDEHSDVSNSVKATEPLSSDTKEISNSVPSGKSRKRDSNIIESTRI